MRREPKATSKSKATVLGSEDSFRMLVEGVTDYAIVMLDPEGHVVSWNPGAERIKGYTRDEIVGKHFSCFYPPEAIKRGVPEKELKAAIKHGRFEDEGWRVRKDGKQFWASVVISALRDKAGKLRGFAKVTRELTERRRNEEQIRILNEQQQTILDASPTMIFYKDRENRFIRVNESFARANGRSKEEMEGKTCWDIYPRETADNYWQDDKEVMSTGQPKLDIVERMETQKGTMYVQSDKIPYRDLEGNVIGVIGFTLDITGRKQAEERIQQQSREIMELSTPVMQVWQGVVVAPLIGSLDSQRTQQFMERLLDRIVETNSSVALVDIMGVPTVDTQTAQHLIETVAAVRLLGAQVVLTGVRPAIAQTLVHLGIDLSGIITRSSLSAGLLVAFEVLNLQVVSKSASR